MRRYLDFRVADWMGRMDSRMQAARWQACMEVLPDDAPLAGVIDEYPEEELWELVKMGWVDMEGIAGDMPIRQAAREGMMQTVAGDFDALGANEYTVVERMLIGQGLVAIDTLPEMEAAFTLRDRLWCDIGVENGQPAARMDEGLLVLLPELMRRKEHREIRGRIFIFDGMLHGMLYMNGYLDDRMPATQFIRDVLKEEPDGKNERLARNFLEASYDIYTMAGCNLLVHEALADPEALAETLACQGAFQAPEMTSSMLAASMNGMLPEEVAPDESLQRALHGALRPEYEAQEAASDLRFLIKQDAPRDVLQEIMASMLFVMPTPHMDGALQEMRQRTSRWIAGGCDVPKRPDGAVGTLH